MWLSVPSVRGLAPFCLPLLVAPKRALVADVRVEALTRVQGVGSKPWTIHIGSASDPRSLFRNGEGRVHISLAPTRTRNPEP